MLPNNSQLTDTVVMIRPTYFAFNPESGIDNLFQNESQNEIKSRIQAHMEFEEMAAKLKDEGVNVIILESPKGPNGEPTPDAVFPNNWFSTHNDRLILYPMKNKSRRNERQADNLIKNLTLFGIKFHKTVDLSGDENSGNYLEGTGSLVLDRINKIAYALKSQRTTENEFLKWCKYMNYEEIFFNGEDKNGMLIYHTNVMLSIGDNFGVICIEALKDKTDRIKILEKLESTGHELIDISLKQMTEMCANVLQLINKKGEKLIVMSERARNAFLQDQIKTLEKYGKIAAVSINQIETVGGGSARCMLAEIFY